MWALLCAVTLARAPAAPGLTRQNPAIGFVNHFPMVARDDDRMREVGADTVMLRAPWALIEPAEGTFDFSIIDRQLDLADRTGLRVVLIMEAGPAHASVVPWLAPRLKSEGQLQKGPDGVDAREPSFHSPTYRLCLARYLRTVTAYVASHRLSRVVTGYTNGCEWWYPLTQSYSPLDVAAFRDRQRRVYGTVAKLNARWGTRFGAWDQVPAPNVFWLGNSHTAQGVLLPATAQLDACYCSDGPSLVPVKPGQKLTLAATFRAKARCGGVTAEIAWQGADKPQPIKIDLSEVSTSGTVRLTATAPPGSAKAWLLVKSRFVGTVTFTSITCRDETGRQLAANPNLDPKLPGWQFVNWSAAEPKALSHTWVTKGAASITYASDSRLMPDCTRPLAAVYDWQQFRAEAVAELKNWMAGEIRAADPTRPIVSYLTFSFANPFEWDYAQQMAIFIDTQARIASREAVIGMQLSSGEGDTDSVACALDMARKYGKPMWAVDLLDFTRGTSLGPAGIVDLSNTVWRHGGTGIQYYTWWGTPHYDYLDLGIDALKRIVTTTRSAARRASAKPLRSTVALVMPRMPLYGVLPEPANDWADFMGWYKLLSREGIVPDVYTLEELPRPDLLKHRVVVVPDCAYAPPDAVRALRAAGARGLRLVMSGRRPRRDMAGTSQAYGSGRWPALVLPTAVGREMLGQVYRQKTPTDTPPRLVCQPGSPRWQSPAARTMRRAVMSEGAER